MDAPSSPLPSPDSPPRRASALEEAQSQIPPLGRRTGKTWRGLRHWLQENTFAPPWLPEPLRHPLIGYLVAALLEVAAAAIVLLLLYFFPSFAFRGVLAVGGVILMALGWGAGPALFATFVGTFLLYYAVLLPHYSWSLADPADALGLLVYLVVGVSISLLASRSERARRQADETARLLAEAEAKSSLESRRLRAVLAVQPSAVSIADAHGRLLEMNQATKTLWGEQAPLVSEIAQYGQYKGWWVRTGEPLAAEDWAMARALTRGEVSLNEELEIETFDGQRKLILHSAVPIRDESGTITGAVVNAQDITELRRLEGEVAERVSELETLFESISDGIALLDAQGNLIQTNRAFRTMLGFTRHPELAARSTRERGERSAALAVRDEHGHPLDERTWPSSRLLRGETLMGVDILITTLEGREMVVEVTGAPVRDAMGQITSCVEVLRDVTARRELEQRTRDALQALVAMGEAIVHPAGVALSSERAGAPPPALVGETIAPLVARRLAALTQSVLGCRRVSIVAVDAHTGLMQPVTVVGLSPEQEQAWWATWSPPVTLEERHSSAEVAALQAGKPMLWDSRHVREPYRSYLFQAFTGKLWPMRIDEELVGLLLVDYGDQDHTYTFQDDVLTGAIARLGALVLERDRLLRRWAEARANELAMQATKEQMDTFLGIASHELKSPLTAIQLGLDLTERRLRASAERLVAAGEGGERALEFVVEHLARTRQQVERLDRLVDDLLDVSRVQAGKLDLRLEDADLAAIVREAVAAQRQAAPDRTIRLEIPAEGRVPVLADPGRIEQVVTNYLTNALKYSAADRPVEVGVRTERQQARVWVRDEGPGLPAEEQERVWERFHRVEGIEVQSGTGIGLGLGLHICRTIVERHQGQVGVESAPGKGSTFWFTVPLAGDATPEPEFPVL